MSRVGNKPIAIPAGVEITVDDSRFNVKGPKGALSCEIPASINHTIENGMVAFSRRNNKPQERAYHGLARALVNNMVVGVTEGFVKSLELSGTGYKWESTGKEIVLNMGYSHPVRLPVPEGITVEISGIRCTVSGIDKQAVGFMAAQIRRVKPPEPYKGKGIKYAGEIIRRKAGKAGA